MSEKAKAVSPTRRKSKGRSESPGGIGQRAASDHELRPIDGDFKHSAEERADWCRDNGHPQVFLNLSLSGKDKQKRKHCQCLCGSVKSVQPESRPGFPVREGLDAEGLTKAKGDSNYVK